MEREAVMRRIHLLAIAVAMFVAVPLFAVSRSNIVDDVVRMQKAGVGEDEIIQFVHKSNSHFDVSADDMIALADAHVSRNVIKAVLDEADARGERRDDRRDDRGYSRGRDTVYVAPYVAGGYPYYAPYGYAPYGYYDPWYYDPWFYGPRVSFGFGFGFGRFGGRPFFGGRGFHHRRW
jgi:hypothetical protein